jgi:hypothetical protein
MPAVISILPSPVLRERSDIYLDTEKSQPRILETGLDWPYGNIGGPVELPSASDVFSFS